MIVRAQGLAVAVVFLGLLVVAIVARSTPSHPLHSAIAPRQTASVSARPVPSQPPAEPSSSAAPRDRPVPPGHTNWLARIVLAGALIWTAWWLSGRWRARTPTRNARHGRADQLADADRAATPDEVSDAIDQSIDVIERGPVTDAVIACWVLVEQAAASAGVAIRPSETSSEFVDRVLGSYGAREAALRRLAALYREARFSTHPMGEGGRNEARACLADIRTDLRGARAAR